MLLSSVFFLLASVFSFFFSTLFYLFLFTFIHENTSTRVYQGPSPLSLRSSITSALPAVLLSVGVLGGFRQSPGLCKYFEGQPENGAKAHRHCRWQRQRGEQRMKQGTVQAQREGFPPAHSDESSYSISPQLT
eukprot:m.13040 g.13040  ORF g.13040 m.13040 type:complete len:133 (-) comp18728_c0_seq1:78-476(-)